MQIAYIGSAEERRRRKNSPTACRKTWTLKRVPSDRGILKGRHARIIIVLLGEGETGIMVYSILVRYWE